MVIDAKGLLRQRMTQYYYRNLAGLAKVMEMNPNTLRKKLRYPTIFKVWELKRLAVFLHLTDEDVAFIVTEKKHSA